MIYIERVVHTRSTWDGRGKGGEGIEHLSLINSEWVKDFFVIVVKDEKGAWGDLESGINVVEEEETLVGALDFKAVIASERGICPEVAIALPDFVGIGGENLSDEWHYGALEMEGDLHVEVAHASKGSNQTRKAAPPLGPGRKVMMLDESRYNLRTTVK
ncbi:Uncharacterized protein Adt_10966 [Abeliophyllum distichum]|uniref:Uncharacterized protein n=1 Tax=Abeliophyllum distichum TaxID=126358 RepID=A0ABD1ULH4_9LAMI